MARIDPRFIGSSPVIQGVYAYCYTGTPAPSNPSDSNVFFDTNTGEYSIHDGSAWGKATAAGTKKFLSLSDGKIYYLANNVVTSEDPVDDTLYFAALNGQWFFCLYGELFLAGTAQ